MRPWDGSNPYGGFGRQLTIDELRAEAPYVPLPNSDLANDGNVGTIWVAGQAQINDVSIHYRSQISYGWVRGATVLGYSPDGYGVQTINGVSAVLVKPDGGQEMFRSGLHEDQLLDMAAGPTAYIEIDGPAGELVDVARTLSPMPPDVSPAGDLPPANPQRSGSVTLWDGFFSDPISRDSVAAAAGSLAFQPVAPSSFGSPSAILETNSAKVAPRDRVLSLRYDDPSIGRFWLLERPSLSTSTALLSEIASDLIPSGYGSAASMVDLGGSVSGLQATDPDFGYEKIVWVENGVYYEVEGYARNAYASTLSAADALSVAKKVAAAG